MATKQDVRILVVDDKADKAMAIASIVSEVGEVVTANSGKEALRCLMSQNFAVILLDVNMPGMDGFETADLIRQRERTPIIFVTSFYEADAHKSRAYSLGAVDYILAPVIPEVLKAKVSVFVDLFRKTEEVKKRAEERVQLMQEQVARIAAEAARAAAEEGERRSAFLAEASRLLSSSLEYEETLKRVVKLAVPMVADWCAVILYEDDDTARIVAVAHADSEKMALAKKLSLDLIPGLGEKLAASTRLGKVILVPEIGDTALNDLTREPTQLSVLKTLGLKSYMNVPLKARQRTMGSVILLTADSGRQLGLRDQALAEDLAGRVSTAVDNARLYNEAQQANRMKDEFLAVVSHELRTPLTPILGWTRMLLNDSLDESGKAHGLAIIERNVRLQAKLIEDLLDVSRIITGKLRLNMRGIELISLIDNCIESLRTAADAKQIEIKTALDKSGNAFSGDGERIQQIMWNLLSNAIKFTPPGGKIEVRLGAPDAKNISIQVSDNGRGISQKFLPFVFDRFRQADSSTTRAYGGLGIGLAIVRHLVELHGGTVQADSKGEGLGATFTIVLPRGNSSRLIVASENGSASQSGTPRAVARRLDGSQILIVDDEPDTRDLLSKVLAQHGAQVIEAGSVTEALDWLDRRKVDAVVSDISMAGDDGYSLIKRIRARGAQNGAGVPAMALTAHARDEDRTRALAAGFQLHMTKPFDPATLIASVSELLVSDGCNFGEPK